MDCEPDKGHRQRSSNSDVKSVELQEDIRTYIQRRDPTGLTDLLQNTSSLSTKTWLGFIEGMLKETSSKDLRINLLDALLSHGTTTKRRLLLNRVCRDIASPDDDPTPRKGLSSTEASQLIASRLILRDPSLIATIHNSRTLFHDAVIEGVESIIVLAIDHAPPGVDLVATINQCDTNQKTALTCAIDHNRVAVMRTLLSKVSSLSVDPAIVRYAITLKLFEIACVMMELRPSAIDRDIVELAVDGGRLQPLALMMKFRSDLLSGSQLLHRAVEKRHPEIVELLLNTKPELATELLGDKYSALAYNIAPKEEHPSVSHKIRNLIVPKIIRRKSPVDIRLLVADAWDQRKEICLDLRHFQYSDQDLIRFLKIIRSGGSTSHATETSKPIFQVEFESTVRYVDIPIPDLPDSGTDSGVSRGLRAEARDILKWLKQERNVDGIYQMRIRDSPYLPHSEDMISESIRNFDIEDLDWRRTDLSIDLIAEHCPNLKKLHLYASNWASLSYWTSKDGLWARNLKGIERFPKLEKVYISIIQDIIGPTRSTDYKEKAKARIKDLDKTSDGKPQRTWKCNVDVRTWSSFKIVSGGRAPMRQVQNTAVEVTRLHAFLQGYGELQRKFASKTWRDNRGLQADLEPKVKIAVIDNGIDHSSISCSHITGASFVYTDNGESPWWLSDDPHGTQMAKIITDIDPYCKLYIAKVGETKSDITRDRVVEAVRWAIQAQVDIISMSAALFKTEMDLEREIKQASSNGIVVISSMAGEGYNKSEAYPAIYSTVLGIAAANAQGKETLNSVKADANYLFQGENIFTRVTYLGSENPQQTISGTSVATAIAAGVASLSLACHRLALSTKSNREAWDNHKIFREKLVKSVFDSMVEVPESKYVTPWRVFPETEDKWSGGEATDVCQWIAENFQNRL